ncbi:MAG TPA: hypothetical protein VLL05_14160 [Terriglobales bacterium]|nr:hypothetical protein [Terriglobales bacterium]
MSDRIAFITHRGKAIMLLDFSQCEPKEILLMLEEIQRTVARHDRNSLLTLADLTGAHIDRAVATRMKEVLVMDRPYVKKSAWVGVDSLPKVYYDNIKSFTQREFPPFQTREAAMDWLTEE